MMMMTKTMVVMIKSKKQRNLYSAFYVSPLSLMPPITWTIPAFMPQPQGVTTLWLVLIVSAHERMARLSWPGSGCWLHTEINVPQRELNLDTVTHRSSDWPNVGQDQCATTLPNNHLMMTAIMTMSMMMISMLLLLMMIKQSTCIAPCMVYTIQTTLKRSGIDHTVLPAINTMPAFTS